MLAEYLTRDGAKITLIWYNLIKTSLSMYDNIDTNVGVISDRKYGLCVNMERACVNPPLVSYENGYPRASTVMRHLSRLFVVPMKSTSYYSVVADPFEFLNEFDMSQAVREQMCFIRDLKSLVKNKDFMQNRFSANIIARAEYAIAFHADSDLYSPKVPLCYRNARKEVLQDIHDYLECYITI